MLEETMRESLGSAVKVRSGSGVSSWNTGGVFCGYFSMTAYELVNESLYLSRSSIFCWRGLERTIFERGVHAIDAAFPIVILRYMRDNASRCVAYEGGGQDGLATLQ